MSDPFGLGLGWGIGVMSSGAGGAPPSFAPSDLTGILVWLAAEMGVTLDGSSRVQTWEDQALANDFAQGTAGARPHIAAADLNGLDVPDFRGAEYLIGPNQTDIFAQDVDEDCYIAIVMAVDTYVNTDLVVGLSRVASHGTGLLRLQMSGTALQLSYRNASAGNTTTAFSSSPAAGGAYALVEIIKDGGTIDCYVNGGAAVLTTATARALMNSSAETDTASPISLGARGDGALLSDVQIAEFVLAKSVPTAQERADYHTWVEATYGLTIA